MVDPVVLLRAGVGRTTLIGCAVLARNAAAA
jgi:hypothetical protein